MTMLTLKLRTLELLIIVDANHQNKELVQQIEAEILAKSVWNRLWGVYGALDA